MRNNRIVLVSFILLLIRSIVGAFVSNTLFLTIVINVLLLYALSKYKIKTSVIFLLLVCFGVIIYNYLALALVDTIIFAFLLSKQEIDRYTKLAWIGYLFAMIIIIILNYFDVIQSTEMYINYKGDAASYASTLGANNPNVTGQLFFSTCALLAINYRNTNKFIVRVLISSIIIYIAYRIYGITLSRTAFISTSLLSFLFLFYPFIIKFEKINRILFSIAPFLIALISFWIVLHPLQYAYLDESATNRVAYPSYAIGTMAPINWLFGLNLKGNAMDTSYLSILFAGGIITFVFLFYQLSKNIFKKYASLVSYEPVIISILAYGITENIFFAATPISVIFYTLILFSNFNNNGQTYDFTNC